MIRLIIFTLIFLFSQNVEAQLRGQLGILDLANANGGINPVTNAPWAAGDTYHIVFVSSTFRDPASGDIADYNAHVQNAANAAGLGDVSWYAIASTNIDHGGTATVDARDNTSTNPGTNGSGVGIFLIDGTTKIADDYNDLWDMSIDNPINLTENNTTYSPPLTSPFGGFGGVWTGTTADGLNRIQAALGGTRADLGLATVTNSEWTRRSDINPHNNAPLGLYAMSAVLSIQAPDPIPTLSQWGLIILGLSILIVGTVAERRKIVSIT